MAIPRSLKITAVSVAIGGIALVSVGASADGTTARPAVETSTTPESTTTTTIEATTTTVEPTTTASTTTTTTTEPVAPAGSNCPQWYGTALKAGWSPKEWATLSFILERESHCHPDSWNRRDPMGGSRGLTQLNGVWCEPNSNWPKGFLEVNGVLSSCEDLFDPLTNLRAARVVYERSGWQPWGL